MTADKRDENRKRAGEHEAEDFGKRLSNLGKKLDAVTARHGNGEVANARGNALGLAFRITTELVAGVVVGGFIGWQLDKWLNTSPFMLLIFFVLGAGAGIANVMRTAREMQRGAESAGNGPKQSDEGSERE